MHDSEHITLNFEVGVLKELYKRNLITREELDRAVKAAKGQHNG